MYVVLAKSRFVLIGNHPIVSSKVKSTMQMHKDAELIEVPQLSLNDLVKREICYEKLRLKVQQDRTAANAEEFDIEMQTMLNGFLRDLSGIRCMYRKHFQERSKEMTGENDRLLQQWLFSTIDQLSKVNAAQLKEAFQVLCKEVLHYRTMLERDMFVRNVLEMAGMGDELDTFVCLDDEQSVDNGRSNAMGREDWRDFYELEEV